MEKAFSLVIISIAFYLLYIMEGIRHAETEYIGIVPIKAMEFILLVTVGAALPTIRKIWWDTRKK